MYIDVNVR